MREKMLKMGSLTGNPCLETLKTLNITNVKVNKKQVHPTETNCLYLNNGTK